MMTNDARHEASSRGPTLFLPRDPARRPDSRAWSLSPELRQQVTRRLRLIAITYAVAFFFAGVFPAALFRELGTYFSHLSYWGPGMGSIAAALGVAVVVSSSRLSWKTKLHIGLVFEVAGSYGIALAQYLEVPDVVRSQPAILHVLSPSWVAVWMMLYSTVVPMPPHKTLIALIASASAPVVVLWSSLQANHLGHLMPPGMFFVHHVLPYMICVGMAHASARVVYRMGADVARAQDLGSYRLIERLGEGGMGEVWRASHQMLARPAAIKFIRPSAMAGVSPGEAATMLRRFEREARVTASLTSAHTVDLYDFGAADDGSFYYVMELLDGLDCDDLVRRHGPLPPARIVRLLTQACESLDEAHRRGLIHRDVKPANLYVCRSGTRYDFVKVLDFGLVAERGAPDASDTRLTRPDRTVGTPQFMPPEIALGKPVDGRTDLYALGCVAYWLATGRLVFSGETFYDLVAKHMNETPEAPSRHAPHALPAELDATILACLEKDPARRPGTAGELARRLRAVPLGDCWGDDEAEAWWLKAGLVRSEAAETVGASTPSRTPPPRT
jgi:serine/threonine-protein kinase